MTVPQKLLIFSGHSDGMDPDSDADIGTCSVRIRPSTAGRAFMRVALMVDIIASTMGCLYGGHESLVRDYAALSQRVLQWWASLESSARQLPRIPRSFGDYDPMDGLFMAMYDLAVMTRPSSSNNKSTRSDSAGNTSDNDAEPVTQDSSQMVGRLRRISLRALTLFGKDKAINDVHTDHVSCSGQHAAIFVQFSFTREEELLSLCNKALAEYKIKQKSSSSTDGTCHARTNNDATNCAHDAMRTEDTTMSTSGYGDQSSHVEHALQSFIDDESQVAFVCTRLLHALQQLESKVCNSYGSAPTCAVCWTIELMLMDLQSTNGTYVNGTRLEPWTPWKLMEGDAVRFAYFPLTYLVIEPE